MHNIETYSRYLHQLVKEGKYENVLINFRENAANFRKDEIAGNSYLMSDLLKCYREQGESLKGLVLVQDYEIDVFRGKETILINQFGWLLHSILKGADDISAVYNDAANRTRDFLCKISFQEENNKLLITQLLVKLIGYEKKQKPVKIDNFLALLKSINIKHDAVKSTIASDAYVVSGMIDIFRKSGHVERALGFLKFLAIDITAKTPEQTLNSYGWCLYTKLKTEMEDDGDDESDVPFDSLLVDIEQNNEENTAAVLDLHPTNETLNLISNSIGLFALEANYSPFSKLFTLSLKAEKQKSNPNWEWMESFLLPFREQSLSEKCETIEFMKAGRPKRVELACDIEVWYSYYSLALLKLKKFEECIEVSKDALFKLERFHYNNDLWFARKIALSNKGLGNVSEAISDLERIEKRKSEWFIQKELSELHFENNQIEKAKVIGIKGALNFGEREKKDGLFFLLGQIFQQSQEKELAFKHFMLSQLIRSEQGWYIPNKLKVAIEETFIEKLQYNDTSILYNELLKFWKANIEVDKSNDSNKKVGRIGQLNESRNIGKIFDKEGTPFFFHFNDFKDRRDKLRLHINVEFNARPPKDNGQGKNWVAFEIKISQ
jgi:hypothetical protein